MDKLNLSFSPLQVLKAVSLNTITGKVDEIVEEVNKLPSMVAATEINALEIQTLRESVVTISQEDFDILQGSGGLDDTKTYYVYE